MLTRPLKASPNLPWATHTRVPERRDFLATLSGSSFLCVVLMGLALLLSPRSPALPARSPSLSLLRPSLRAGMPPFFSAVIHNDQAGEVVGPPPTKKSIERQTDQYCGGQQRVNRWRHAPLCPQYRVVQLNTRHALPKGGADSTELAGARGCRLVTWRSPLVAMATCSAAYRSAKRDHASMMCATCVRMTSRSASIRRLSPRVPRTRTSAPIWRSAASPIAN